MNVPVAAPASRFKWRAAAGGLLAVVALAMLLGYAMGFMNDNFHEISPKCCRSAQLSDNALRDHVAREKLRCIVNLRGVCKDQWYESELKLCSQLHVAHADFKLDPQRLPQPEVLNGLIEQLKNGPHPLLLHCRNGADRTGLAATLFSVVVEGRPVKEAMDSQLSWRYGHIAMNKNNAAERLFAMYSATATTGESFEEWARKDYAALYEKAGPYGK